MDRFRTVSSSKGRGASKFEIQIVVRKAGPLVAAAVLRIVCSFEKKLVVDIIAAARQTALAK